MVGYEGHLSGTYKAIFAEQNALIRADLTYYHPQAVLNVNIIRRVAVMQQ